jgi:tripartite-type tricarboxylate transporter receptor subunit TctC
MIFPKRGIKRGITRSMATLAVCALSLGTAVGQAAYPSRPVTIVVPYPSGGVADAMARAFAEQLKLALKQPFVVENRGGGNTLPGSAAVASAAPDGHTLLLTAENTLTINPYLYAKLPYDADKSFTPVIALARVPQSLVVSKGFNATTLQQFISNARANPDKVSYATLGVGSTPHMNMIAFQKATGTKLLDVPYRGASPALLDVIGGTVNAMLVSTGLVAPQIASGKLTVLAVEGNKRSPLLPNVPTFTEAGLPNFTPTTWFALLAPAGTPPAVVSLLNAEMNRILSDRSVREEQIEKRGLEAIGGSPGDLKDLIDENRKRMGPLVREANIRLTE